MKKTIAQFIESLDVNSIDSNRKEKLINLAQIIQGEDNVMLNFICTHNSRRSHLGQVWGQTIADYYNVSVTTFSGGTEATALFPKVAETLEKTGFEVIKLSQEPNPVYGIKNDDSGNPMIAFSKKYDDSFNPKSNYIAIMTCSSADEGCPVVIGSKQRFSLTHEDPKISDGTDEQSKVYTERSKQIATELKYLFQQVIA